MSIEVHPYDPAWPQFAAAAITELHTAHPGVFTAIEHLGSTAVPGLPAKPVIDLMAAVDALAAVPDPGLGYTLIETGMPERLFYRREPAPAPGRVETDSEAKPAPAPVLTSATTTASPAPAGHRIDRPIAPEPAGQPATGAAPNQVAAAEPNDAEPGKAGAAKRQHRDPAERPAVHLHIVTTASWPTRNERLLRDHLLRHPAARDEYGRLKQSLAATNPDGDTYTRAKTDLIQRLVDAARTERGLPLQPVWEA
ncbi:GrpB family protein [Dactylosporangium sp. CA-052675]|uniref:GrpB family protein n=1 Tax=Dactylosporangium sp. CA-052675 TaxID=3239927 RepID=UPI003D8BCCD4